MRKVLDFFNRFGSAIWWGCVLLILLVVYINRAEFKQIVIDQLEWSLEVDAKGDPEAIQSKLLDLLKGEEAEISGTYMDIGGSVQIEIFQDETGLNYITYGFDSNLFNETGNGFYPLDQGSLELLEGSAYQAVSSLSSDKQEFEFSVEDSSLTVWKDGQTVYTVFLTTG